MIQQEQTSVLLVDDDPDDHLLIRDKISEYAQRFSRIDSAYSINEGLKLARENGYDVILSDYRMGRETGIDFIRNLRAMDQDTPVILLTGVTDTEIDQAGLEAGATDFVAKDSLTGPIIDRAIRYAIANAKRQQIRAMQEYERVQQQLLHISQHDELTGVPNRSAFYKRLDDEIAEAIGRDAHLVLSVFELNNIKEINDVHGYAVGDRLLIETTERLKMVLREDDYLARLDGNEFAAIHRAKMDEDSVPRVAGRIAAAMDKPFLIDGQMIATGISLGIAGFPFHGDSRQDLLANADAALYRAKHSPDQVICVYDQSMDIAIRERRAIASELSDAIANEELEVHFQPQASVSTGEILGFEALARWNNPERGFIPPSTFIPIAEKSGAIIQLGEWALKKSCQIAAAWGGNYKIAVNVSPVQIAHSDLPELVRETLAKTGLLPTRLELEVTEATLIADIDCALRVMRDLKKIGVSIAMDDFGTGYSSLSALHTFPVDLIKIDRSFIDQVHVSEPAAQIVRSILGLGRNLNIPVLAEGVEIEEHVAFLSLEDCDEMQGYFIGKPTSAANTADIITRGDVSGDDRVAGIAAA